MKTTCQEAAAVLSDYVDGNLPPEEAALMKSHLDDCPPCASFLKSFKVATDATRLMLLKQIPGDFQNRLKSFLKARCGGGH
ncbi:MAG: anti-sigma factor [Myxococcota bacterium]